MLPIWSRGQDSASQEEKALLEKKKKSQYGTQLLIKPGEYEPRHCEVHGISPDCNPWSRETRRHRRASRWCCGVRKAQPQTCGSRRRCDTPHPLVHFIRPLRCQNDSDAPHKHAVMSLNGRFQVRLGRCRHCCRPPPPPLSDMTAGAVPGKDKAAWENPTAVAGPQINNTKQDKESETRLLIPHWEHWEKHWEALLMARGFFLCFFF